MRLRPTSPLRRAIAACALVAAGNLVLPLEGARAEGPTTVAEPAAAAARLAAPSPDLPGLPAVSLDLAAVPVDSPAFRRATTRYRRADADHTAARGRRVDLDRTATELRAQVAELEATRVAAEARARGLTTRLSSVEAAIQELAVRSFVAGGDAERLNTALASETPAINEVARRDVLGGVSMQVLLTERASYRARIDEAIARATEARDALAAADAALERIAAEHSGAISGEQAAGGQVAAARVAYEDARVLATVDGVEFPLVALDAYYRAAATVAAERPTCAVRWWGLAGISRVEGRHGTYGGTTLDTNGDTSRRIIGIPLDGARETAVVGDSDGGAYDGDATFDRAVGPMQFIPQTWSRFRADGNGDGTMSPFNLYDATLAAATYLCTVSGGLDADPGLRAAYFAYNHSVPYVDSVLGFARFYEQAVDIPDPAR